MSGVQMPVSAILILLVAMIPLATLFAALLLSISTFSRNMKEARTYEQPILWVAMMMAMISFLPAVEINNLMALIPVVNIALLFKAVMINEYALSHLLITIGSTLLLDVVAIWATIKLFTTESVLFRSEDDSGSMKAVGKNKLNFFNPFYGLVYFSIALIALYYLGSYWQANDLMKGLLQTQLFIIALPVYIIIRMLKLKEKDILRLKLPKPKELLLIPFIAISAAIIVSVVSQLINLIFPFPPKYIEMLSKLFTMDPSFWKVLLVMAVAPGICEEYMFRGFLIRFYEKYGIKSAIVLSALLFAAFHLDPFRFVPVFLLGLLLGYLTLRSGSLVNSMLSHTINNGLALVIVTYGSSTWLKPLISGEDSLQYWLIIPAGIVFAGAIYLFHKVTEKGDPTCVE
jgi:sodium transport system permease protein